MGDQKQEQMAGEPTSAKTVKIKTLRAINVGTALEPMIVEPGQIIKVTEAQAKEFCDRKFAGYHPFYGYMPEIGPLMGDDVDGKPIPNPMERKKLARAVRIA
jgi:hypothetical protein